MKCRNKIITGLVIAACVSVAAFYAYYRNSTNYELGISQLNGAIASSVTMSVFEGLPHPRWERELFKQELQSQHFDSRDHKFYIGEIKISDVDRIFLVSIFREQLLRPSSWDVAKACGGFHPDFQIIWQDSEGNKSEAYFCFTCSEVHFYSGIFGLKANIPEDLRNDLRTRWAPYRNQRPEPKR